MSQVIPDQEKIIQRTLDLKYTPKDPKVAKEYAFYTNERYILDLGEDGARLHLTYAQIILSE